MKFKTITWEEHTDFPNIHKGLLDGQEIFTINSTVKGQKFELKSWPLKSDAFFNSTSDKFLGEFETLSLAKYEAQTKWEEFTNGLLQTEEDCPTCGGDCGCKE